MCRHWLSRSDFRIRKPYPFPPHRILPGRRREIDRDSGTGICVGERVGASAPGQRVVPGPAFNRVIAIAAVDDVRIAVAGQNVIMGRAGQVLEAR